MRADASAYRALVRRRWWTFVIAALVFFGLAAVIEIIEYRLLIIAIVVAFPAVVPLIDAVFTTKFARAMGSCEVSLDGELLTLKPGLTVDLKKVTAVRVQRDAVYVNEKWGPGPKQVRVHLLPGGDVAEPLLRRLEAQGVKLAVETMTLATLALALWGLLAQHGLDKLGGLLIGVGVLFVAKALIDGDPVEWEAYACLAGGAVALGLRALILHFLPPEAKGVKPRG